MSREPVDLLELQEFASRGIDARGMQRRWPEARITGLWEHHAVVAFEGPGPALGEVVAVVPNHACTAVNLVPELLVAEGGEVVDRWPVAARAANR